MIDHIEMLISNANAKQDTWAMLCIRDMISTLANTHTIPSSWNSVGEKLAEEYKENKYIYDTLELWKYE